MNETPTILLVDDNERLRELYRISLETVGGMQIVGQAANGREGIDAAERLHPDIVVLDLSMPTMDGLEALNRIRAASPQSHVVVLTGFKRDRLEELAIELGASAFLEKGIPPTQFADALRLATAMPPPPYRELTPGAQEALARRVRELI